MLRAREGVGPTHHSSGPSAEKASRTPQRKQITQKVRNTIAQMFAAQGDETARNCRNALGRLPIKAIHACEISSGRLGRSHLETY